MSSPTWAQSPERPERPEHDAAPTAPGTPDPAPAADQSWHPWSAPVALVSALILAIVGGLVLTLAAVAFGAGEIDDTPPGVLMGATFVQDLGFIAAAIVFARLTGPVFARQFGLRRTRFWPAVGWVLLLYVAFGAFGALWQLVVEIEEDDVLEQLGADDSNVALAFALLLVCVAAPVVEEFFFRGFFYGALRNWRGIWPAAILTGVVFGGIHLGGSPIGAIVPLMVFGFGLCLLYERTGSLYPCIAVHAINNAIAFSVLNEWTWQVPLVIAGALAACFAIALPAARRWPPPGAREPAPAPA